MSRSVAWTGTAEWVQVYEWLYSQNETDQHKGVARVNAWQARQKLPMAIEATAALRDCILKDRLLCALSEQEYNRALALVCEVPVRKSINTAPEGQDMAEGEYEGVSDDEDMDREEIDNSSDDPEDDQEDVMVGGTSQAIRLMYAMSVVRFVNGMVDSVQKGVHARSVSALANELGLPEWVVDFRHDATHTALPTLASCRMTGKFILEWLRFRYWETQARYEPELQALLKAALKHYTSIEVQLSALSDAEAVTMATSSQTVPAGKGKKKAKTVKPTKKPIASNTASVRALFEDRTAALDEVVRLCGSRGVACEMLIPMLLKTGMMVPVDKRMRPASLLGLGVECIDADPKNLRAWSAALGHFERAWPGFLSDMLSTMVSTLAAVSQPAATHASESPVDVVTVHPSPSRLRSIVCWAIYVLIDHHAEPRVFIEETVAHLQSFCTEWANEYTHTVLLHLLRFSSAEERHAQQELMQLSHSNPTTKAMRSRPRTTIGSNPHSNSKRTRSTSNTTDAAANSTSNDSKTNDGNDSDHTAARTGDRGDDSNHVTDEDIMALLSTHHATSSATLGMQKMSKVEASQLDARALSGWRLLIGHPAAVDVNDANSLTITPAIFETLRTQRREQLHSSGSGRRAQARSAEGSTNESLTHVGAVRGPTDTTANVLKRVRLF